MAERPEKPVRITANLAKAGAIRDPKTGEKIPRDTPEFRAMEKKIAS